MLKGNSKAVVAENVKMMRDKGMSEKDAIMASMKRSKSDKNKEEKVMKSSPTMEDYPYGLRLELDHESMKKLGMKDLPDVGKKLKLHAHAVVRSASEHRDSGDGEPRRSTSLQITHMGMMD